MDDAILPLHSVSKQLVKEYLNCRGMPSEVVEWKFYDEDFNRGRERGYVWTRDGLVHGFIGLIPWNVCNQIERLEMVWGCDWSVNDPNVSKGMGMALAAHAMSLHRPWISLGGSEKARTIMPHLANRVVEAAGLVFWHPLRLGAALKKLGERHRLADWLGHTFLRSVPIRWVRPRSSRSQTILTVPGLSPAVADLIEQDYHPEWHPHHRFSDLQWSMGRCPSIAIRTSYITGLSGIEAAAVFWRSTQASDFWKVALWADPTRRQLLSDLLHEVRWQVYEAGGLAISTLVSHLETDLIDHLQAAGYWRQPRPLPLYLLSQRKQPLPFGDMTGLSYVCTDLAYRF